MHYTGTGISFDRIIKKISYFETKLVGFLKFFSILFIDTLIMLINFNKHNKFTDFESFLCVHVSIVKLRSKHSLNYDPLPISLCVRMPRPKT